MYLKFKVWALCFFMLGAFVACTGPSDDRVVARFDGGSLTVEDLDAHKKLLEKKGLNGKRNAELTQEEVFDHAVNMELIIAKGLKEELHLDPSIRASIHEFMSDLFLKVMQDKLVPAIDRESFTEKEVKDYFDKNIESYRTKPVYAVKVIQHSDPAFLGSLKKTIESGGQSFEDAAKAHSTDEATKMKGGDTGRRTIDLFRLDWRKAIEPLETGKISEPLAIGKHHWLFKVVDKTKPVTPTFEEKKAYVRNDLLYSKYRDEWRKAYDKMKKEFDLKTNDQALHLFMEGGCGHDHAH